jgi:hypothetical protein
VKASAVSWPTPGIVINRRQAAEALTSCLISALDRRDGGEHGASPTDKRRGRAGIAQIFWSRVRYADIYPQTGPGPRSTWRISVNVIIALGKFEQKYRIFNALEDYA